MRRIVAIIMAMALTVVTTLVPSTRSAKAFVLPGGQEVQLLHFANKSQQRPSVPVKPCPRGAAILSCPFYAPSPETGVPGFVGLATIFAEAKASHLRGRAVVPPCRPPKHLSA